MTATNQSNAYEDPDWAPLEAALPADERLHFMYMGHAEAVVLSKYRWTRRTYASVRTERLLPLHFRRLGGGQSG